MRACACGGSGGCSTSSSDMPSRLVGWLVSHPRSPSSAEGGGDGHLLAFAEHVDLDLVVRLAAAHGLLDVARGLDRLAVELDDHVTRLDPGRLCAGVGDHLGDERAGLGVDLEPLTHHRGELVDV